jgi:hypothetical protein
MKRFISLHYITSTVEYIFTILLYSIMRKRIVNVVFEQDATPEGVDHPERLNMRGCTLHKFRLFLDMNMIIPPADGEVKMWQVWMNGSPTKVNGTYANFAEMFLENFIFHVQHFQQVLKINDANPTDRSVYVQESRSFVDIELHNEKIPEDVDLYLHTCLYHSAEGIYGYVTKGVLYYSPSEEAA